MNVSKLRNLAQPLLEFSEVLGNTLPDWGEREELNHIRYESDAVDSGFLQHLEFKHVQLLAQSYRNALSCRFLVGDDVLLDQNGFLDKDAFDSFKQELQRQPSLGFDFLLDKQKLLSQELGRPPNGVSFFLYFYIKGLTRLLQESNLGGLETQLWGDDQIKKAVVFVLDADVSLIGELLEIKGGRHLIDWPPADRPGTESVETREIYRNANRFLRWQKPWLKRLTPDYLFVSGESENSVLLPALHTHLINGILLYTADRTTERAGMLTSAFDSTKESVTVRFAKPVDLQSINQTNVEALFKIYRWAYEDERRIADRLLFVQTTVVQTLKSAPEENRCQLLLQNALGIYSDLQWQWKGYVEGIVEQYTEQVRLLEDYVSQTVQSFSTQISEITKALSETMLAAVAVVIGSFIAALFSSDFNPTVFRIGVWTYAGYVFFFSLLYNMISQWSWYQAVIDGFGVRQKHFENYLGRQKVKRLATESIGKSKKRFLRWFWLTAGLYLCVAILGVLAGLYLPVAIQSSASTPLTPIPTVTKTPTLPATIFESTSAPPITTLASTPAQ